MTLYDQLRGLTQQRRNDPDGLGAIAVKAERGMLFRLERAFQACFRRCKAGEDPGYPRFRPISRMETIDIVDPRTTMVKKRARGYAIRPKGFPTIRLFPARPLPDGELKALRIVRKRAVLSTGERIERNTRDWAEIRRQQREIARCRRGSNRRKKRVRRLAGMRFREGVRNRNACHRQTTEIIRKNGLIAVEKLDIKGMTTKGLKRKGLNREMLSQQWGLLRNQLQYKAEWAGREFVEVNPQYTSQDCHRCGARNRPGRSETYRCSAYDLRMDRDHNAALNILRAGVLALGAETWASGPSVAPELGADVKSDI